MHSMNRRRFVSQGCLTLAATSIASSTTFGQIERASMIASRSAGPRRIIIDTDPGVDDAFAIFLAITSPELKIEAITAVAGNVPLSFTLPNALRLVEIAGRTDIPVAAGATAPLVRRLISATDVHGQNGFAGAEFPAPSVKPVSEPAVDVLRAIIGRNPGEITLVCLGPLTNIAQALQADPALAGKIAQITMMGGSLSGGNISPAAEFNFYVDPEAADIVFRSGVPITMVGLDVTEKVTFTEKHLAMLEAANGPVSMAAAKIARQEFGLARKRGASGFHMHDPLAMSSLLDSEILRLEDYLVKIETAGLYSAGASYGYKHNPVRGSAPMKDAADVSRVSDAALRPNAKVAVGVNSDRFFELLIPRLTKA
ncbi:nucleoside hydrolase [Granulicella sp. S156]|uniref:nucleoside hydrolase n=1 Tax=Granulicella sp. S156 TaxID=1747224 RepID=UPI00131B2936|nr:nucleoside hydrolase [Granulicella sp. S156]